MTKFKDSHLLIWIFTAIAFDNSIMATLMEKSGKLSVAAGGCREFSTNYHKAIARSTEGNIINSPLSTHLVLSCLFHGSDGHTAREMMTGLCLTDTENLHFDYKKLTDAFDKKVEVRLSLSNAIFLQEGVKLGEKFLSRAMNFYNFTVRNVNFGDNVGSTEKINSWISKNTEGKINDIVTSDDIDDYTKVILVNSVYFKGEWKNQFRPGSTEDRVFHLSETSKKQVPTMFKKFDCWHGDLPNLKSRFLEIPYKDEKLVMIIVLPNEIEGLAFVEENFNWNAIVTAERSRSMTELYLPKFKIEATIDLKKILIELGFTSMFEDTADFSGLSDVPLKVDSVIQKAFLEVNEFGTEAAAATAVRMIMKRSLVHSEDPDEFIVDRPFIVAVRHVIDDTPLFLASIRDISVIVPKKDEL